MHKQLETTDPQPKKRGFFDRPASFDFYMNAGGRFWGGLVMGAGAGLFIGALWVRPDSGLWPVGTAGVLWMLGWVITQHAVNRSAKPGTERPKTEEGR
jgi:hypothetical protein